MAAICNKLTLTERINTGEFSFREYEIEVLQSDISSPEKPEALYSVAERIINCDPMRSAKPVVPRPESVTKRVLSPK